MNTDPSKRAGFRPAQPWGDDPHGIGWRFWVGPLIVARVRGFRRPSAWRGNGTVALTALGVSVGWSR